jgi:hypothetical protein
MIFDAKSGGHCNLGDAPRHGALELDERALRLRGRLGCLLRRDDAADLVVVPRRSGLARRLHLRVHDRGICPGLHHAGHPSRPGEEALRPAARRLVHIPVEALGEHEAACGLETEPMD